MPTLSFAISSRTSNALTYALIFVAGILVPASKANASGTTYYVDSNAGNDSNNGTSSSTPWQTLTKVNGHVFQAGDQLLLLAGDSWSGQLALQGSGSAGSPITVTSYGSGAKPIIAGNASVASPVLLKNEHDLIVDGIEVTNTSSATVSNTSGTFFNGVEVLGQDYGALANITLQNLYVHNIDGDSASIDIGYAGILIHILGNTTPTWFSNITVQDNELGTVQSYGISFWSSWMQRDGYTSLHGIWAELPYTSGQCGPYTASHGLEIRSNYIHDIATGAIIAADVSGAVIEHNRVVNALDGHSSVAVWWAFDDHLVAQYNDISNTFFHGQAVDSTAFDSDQSSYANVVQYNFSHNNGGGFMETCCGGNDAQVLVRYNVSQNDTGYVFWLAGNAGRPSNMYNNTVYASQNTSSDPLYKIAELRDSGENNYSFENNIIINPLSVPVDSDSGANTWGNNLYDGGPSSQDSSPILGNPSLASAGNATSINNMTDYLPQSGSPAIGVATTIAANGGFDILGTQVPSAKPDMGAVQTSTTTVTPTSTFNTESGYQLSALVDKNLSTYWNSDPSSNGASFPGTITLDYSQPQTFSTLTVSCIFCLGQGPTNVDVLTWNGSAWVTQVSGQVLSWASNSSTEEFRTISLPRSVTTSSLELVVHAAHTTWGHFALAEIQLGNWFQPISSTTFGTSSGNISNISDADPTTSWASSDETFPNDVALQFQAARTISSITVSAVYGQGQGITSFDIQTWNGSAWVTQVSSAAITWTTNTGTVEAHTINLPSAITTSQVQLVVKAANNTWGHIAVSELSAQ